MRMIGLEYFKKGRNGVAEARQEPRPTRRGVLLGVLAAVLAAGTTSVSWGGTITIKGSDTLVILAQKWAEAYMTAHPETQIQVNGGGSGVGLAALQNQTTDLATASRKIKPKEEENCIKAFKRRPREYKVALDGLSVYVNESNPVKELSLSQVEGIFTGRVRNWKEVGGNDAAIALYSRENSSGTYEFFKEHVLTGKDFAASAQTMPGTAAVLQAVGKDPGGIGYGGAAYGGGARALNIRKTDGTPAVEPTEANVMSGQYPIWRHLFIYVNPAKDTGEIALFLNWARSDAGQALVKEVGYFPLPKNLRAAPSVRTQ